MMFMGEETIKQGTNADSKIRATTENFPTRRGNLIPHVRDFYVSMETQFTGTTATEDFYFLEDYLLNVFSNINIKLTDGSMLYETTDSKMARVIAQLYYQNLDDWVAAQSTTATINVKFPIPLNWEKSFDAAGYTYLYPSDEFAEVDIPTAWGAAIVPGGFWTTTTVVWRLIADIVWLDARFRSPVRTWRNIPESNQQVTLPAGLYQYGIISNDKGTTEARYVNELTVTGTNFEIKREPGWLLQMQWAHDLLERFDAGQMFNDLVAATSPMDYALQNHSQPVFWGKEHSLLPQDGIRGPFMLRRSASDPVIDQFFYLQSYGA
jgi:hypothetical protein